MKNFIPELKLALIALAAWMIVCFGIPAICTPGPQIVELNCAWLP